MARFIFSAFADEYSKSFDEQLKGLTENGISLIEIRGVDGTNIADITEAEAKKIKQKLDKAHIGVSAIGSPIGKVDIDCDYEEYKSKIRHVCRIANILSAERVRVFSFYIPEGKNADDYTDSVIAKVGEMLDIADEYGVRFCFENEKGIYGNSPERCLALKHYFGDRMGVIFDPANFIQCGYDAFPDAFDMLKDDITYMHIKDAKKNGNVVETARGLGGIPEILAYLNRTRDDEIVLTVEPHLWEFNGLSELEKNGGRTDIRAKYASEKDAFRAAVYAARMCIPRGAEVR